MTNYEYDAAIRGQERLLLAGVDEAGRGPLAGPVYAAAVILRQLLSNWDLLKNSHTSLLAAVHHLNIWKEKNYRVLR